MIIVAIATLDVACRRPFLLDILVIFVVFVGTTVVIVVSAVVLVVAVTTIFHPC